MVKDEVPLVQNPLTWSVYHKNDCTLPPVTRDEYEALLKKNWWGCKTNLSRPLYIRNSHKFGKKWVHEDSAQSVLDLQASLEYPCPVWECSSNSCFHCRLHLTHEWWREERCNWYRDQFRRKVNEINTDKLLSDFFFFNGASNVQTAGAILCTTYTCFVLVFQQPLQTQSHIGLSYIFCLLFLIFLTYFSGTCCQVL